MSKQEPDKAYFVEMVFTHMGIIYKICKLYAAEEDRDDLKQEIIYQLWLWVAVFILLTVSLVFGILAAIR